MLLANKIVIVSGIGPGRVEFDSWPAAIGSSEIRIVTLAPCG